MTDTTFAREEVAIVETAGAWNGWSAISWSGVIAGAFAATAVWVIFVALGSGIGLALSSPFSSSPSSGTMTVMGAVWLVFAQGIGAAVGGYMAGRLRTNPSVVHTGEVKFRDGANGLLVWAIGVVLSLFLVAGAVGKIGGAAGTAAATGAAASVTAFVGQTPSIDYFSDSLLRTTPQAQAGGASAGAPAAGQGQADNGNANMQRQQVNRILLTALGPNGLSNDDRTYLAQIVSARSGMSMDDAQKRVDSVVNMAKADASQAADTARKAAEYLAFWTFMSLLFGAACATLGGILGGELRDEFSVARATPTVPR